MTNNITINLYCIIIMLYRNINGDLIVINKMDFKNDKLFYKKIMDIKKPFTKLNNY